MKKRGRERAREKESEIPNTNGEDLRERTRCGFLKSLTDSTTPFCVLFDVVPLPSEFIYFLVGFALLATYKFLFGSHDSVYMHMKQRVRKDNPLSWGSSKRKFRDAKSWATHAS